MSFQIFIDKFFTGNPPLEKRIDLIKEIPWKKGAFIKQSWPNWLHHMAPYAGRMTPQISHWLIRAFSNPNEVVLDPFCGIGTVPLEANLLNRESIGFDLNPYAFHVADGKMERKPLDDHLEVLDKITINTSTDILDSVPKWVHEYYNKETLVELLFTIDFLQKTKQRFILGALLGVAQGHRIGHISKASAVTLPFKPKADDPGLYKEVLPRLVNKIKRLYKNGFPIEPKGKISRIDSRKMPLNDNSVDSIITSPPYLDNLDYVNSNRLRLALLGYFGQKASELSKELKYKKEPYIEFMNEVFQEVSRVLKPKGNAIFIIGDVYNKPKPIKTMDLLSKSLENANLKLIKEIPDTIPFNRSVQRTTNMQNKLKPHRLDRILVISNEK